MINEEDCCDNCEEGIEPCCDEELAQHIDNIFAEVEKPVETVKKVKTTGVTTNIEDLAKHLCCQNKFYIIYKHMGGLSKTELKKLRDDLRSYVPGNVLHHELERRFNREIG